MWVFWYGLVWYGMAWYGMVWYGMVWYGMVSTVEIYNTFSFTILVQMRSGVKYYLTHYGIC